MLSRKEELDQREAAAASFAGHLDRRQRAQEPETLALVGRRAGCRLTHLWQHGGNLAEVGDFWSTARGVASWSSAAREPLTILPRSYVPLAAAQGGVFERRWCESCIRVAEVGAGRDDLVDTVEQGIVEVHVDAPSWLSRCSSVRGPMIAAVTAGWLRTKARAMWISEIPASSASCARASAASSFRWLAGSERSKRPGSRSARMLEGGSLPFRQAPVSQPLASGLQGITPIPWRWQTGSTSASTPRTSSEYGGCSQTKRSRPRDSATHCAATISLAG